MQITPVVQQGSASPYGSYDKDYQIHEARKCIKAYTDRNCTRYGICTNISEKFAVSIFRID